MLLLSALKPGLSYSGQHLKTISLTQYCLYIRNSSQSTSRTMKTARMTEAISHSDEEEEYFSSSCFR